MDSADIFISHTTADDDFVKQLREALTSHGLTVWDDARYLRGGDELWPEVAKAIEAVRHFIVVFSRQSLSSKWVFKEVEHAKKLEAQGKANGESYRVIPLLLDDAELGALQWVFPEEGAVIRVSSKPGGLTEKMNAIRVALGKELPTDQATLPDLVEKPIAELLLELRNLKVKTAKGKACAKAEATLTYQPPEDGAREIKSGPFVFTSPLGPIENANLRWYLEKFYQWPVGEFKACGAAIAKQLPKWGKLLYDGALKNEAAQEALRAWLDIAGKADRRFSVEVSDKLPKSSRPKAVASAKEAASLLLSLPWELLHDERGFLFHGKHAVRVRRRLPNYFKQGDDDHDDDDIERKLPIRILLVSPRPEDDEAEYIDHRVSAKPLVEAVETLGDLVSLTILQTPTFPALQQELKREQFDVVHFDGHGVFDPRVGLGKLCFEAPDQDDRLANRKSELIDATLLAEVMRDHRIPLVFLEACQSAKTDDDPTASVAAKLLEQGVVSVVAMTHSVLVETARRFVKKFYRELADGARIGAAMLAGQQALRADTRRGAIAGAGEFHLQDWFVPVLYQERQDPSLVRQLLSPAGIEEIVYQRKFSLGELPAAPEHSFIGRSRELLALERMLLHQPYAVIRGAGGEGKTTLAVELARWLVKTNRFRRAAFVSLEQYSDAKGVADTIGRQLVGAGYTAAGYKNWREALLPINRELKDKPTIILVDNVESLFSPTKTHEEARREENILDEAAGVSRQAESEEKDDQTNLREPSCDFVGEVFLLCQALLEAHPATRIVFTSREHLPKLFANPDRVIELDRLSREDAVELVSRVLHRREYDEKGNTPTDIAELVESVNRHARALTLLAREIKVSGLRATTDNLLPLMARLETEHPGDRENSLYASVALSLRRLPLPPVLREQVKALAFFHGGANLRVLPHVLGVDEETAKAIRRALIEVGLAEEMEYGHVRLDPALPGYLLREWEAEARVSGELQSAADVESDNAGEPRQPEVDRTSSEELTAARARWAEAMEALTDFLYQQFVKDAQLAATLTLLELPNLLALLAWFAARETPEQMVNLAQKLETLLANLGRPQALMQATRAREQAARRLMEKGAAWSHARFQTEATSIDRLLERGQLPQAKAAALRVLDQCLLAGEAAFAEAAYDIATAHALLGHVLNMSGEHEAALPELAEAERRFAALGAAGNADAERMAAVAINDSGDGLLFLGRLNDAAARYEEAIKRAEKLGYQRQAAVGKGNLATVRKDQRRYAEALAGYAEAREIFERLGEPQAVATAWHQTAIAHSQAGQFEQAEQAYRQSLKLWVQQQDAAGEAATLLELGNLADLMGRLAEAVNWYRQAAEIRVRLGDLMKEGLVRSNLADTLIKLESYDEARGEVRRAIECNQPFGHGAEPWKAWDILHNLEQATGHADAAAAARGRALSAFLAYRRTRGENHELGAQLCAMVLQAMQRGEPAEAEAILDQLSADAATPANRKPLLPKLSAILRGGDLAALAGAADDPALFYQDAVELTLLLEALDAQSKEEPNVEKG